jgi:hypothetical protein
MATTGTTTKVDHEEAMELGCSSSSMKARTLNEVMTCQQGTLFCWHACISHTDEASPEACESKDLDLACINDAGELWDGIHDGSFFPGCVDLTMAVTSSDVVHSTMTTVVSNHTNTTGSYNAAVGGDNQTATSDYGRNALEGDDDSTAKRAKSTPFNRFRLR